MKYQPDLSTRSCFSICLVCDEQRRGEDVVDAERGGLLYHFQLSQ